MDADTARLMERIEHIASVVDELKPLVAQTASLATAGPV